MSLIYYDLKGRVKLTRGTAMKMKIGKYNVTARIKIVGLTESAKEDMNRLLAKEEGKNDERGTEKEI
jgi:hypothetical protein